MNFNELPEFSKEFKRLANKYRSLPKDLDEFKKVLLVRPCGQGKHFNIITKNEQCVVVKARLFCRYLKGSSLRIIYAFHNGVLSFCFIEMYSKSEKVNEDRKRIKYYLNQVYGQD